MKTIFLGDTHGRSFWKLILSSQEWDRVVFIGDYFDIRDGISAVEQIHNFKEIVQFKKDNPNKEVILLLGNHDMYIYSEMQQHQISGYQSGAASNIQQVLQENKEHLQMAFSFDNILCTHAGVGMKWLEDNGFVYEGKFDGETIAMYVNEVWKYKPLQFKFNGWDQTGDNIGQTPIWIRPASLMRDAKELNKNGIIQIVGHTTMQKMDLENYVKIGYFFIDTLGTSGEYLIYEDGVFTLKSVK